MRLDVFTQIPHAFAWLTEQRPLAAILGTGNLEQLNRFTAAQAKILKGNAGDIRTVLRKLRTFTGLLANRKTEISSAVDSLTSVERPMPRWSYTSTA